MKLDPRLALLILLAGSASFTGCLGGAAKKQVPVIPKMLVFPVDCDCPTQEIGTDITKGFVESMPKKMQVFNLQEFEKYLSSRTVTLDQILTAVKTDAGSTPGEIPSYSTLVRDLLTKSKARASFYQLTEIDYLVVGRAKEKVLTGLEEGNLRTAQTADIKMMDLKTGEILVDESFRQGRFEVVAPNRIGYKLANQVDSKLDQIKKEQKQKAKDEKRRQQRRRNLTAE